MRDSRAFRVLFVGSLTTATLGVLLLSAWLFRPHRDESIRSALQRASGPAFWWPPSWRAEYRAVRDLIECLTYGTGGDLTALSDAVIEFNEGKAAVEPLIELFMNENEETRRWARVALIGIGPIATQPLICALTDPRQNVVVRSEAAFTLAVLSLGTKESEETTRVLLDALNDDKAMVRVHAAHALAFMDKDSKPALESLIDSLNDSDPDVCVAATSALSYLGPKTKAAVPNLIRLLRHPEAKVRGGAAWALGAIGADAKPAVAALVELLGDNDSDVRSYTAYALGEIGPDAEAAVPALILLLDDNESHDDAAEALKKIDPEAAVKSGVK